MAKVLCANITSEQANYTNPVPFIGFYIAAATMVCFLLMICDLVNGIRSRKLWLPCRFFSLNSVTLTLLAIAAKLPVDLTTSMPSAYDQLSKLTGIALICVSMGFIMPSLGTNTASECLTNMAALTILVVTVVVNICIQMSTGLIFSFIAEHIIIMASMLIMLIILWISTWCFKNHEETQMNHRKDFFAKGQGSMLRRLKLCYLHGYISEPQHVLCNNPISVVASSLCLICLAVVLQVSYRSFVDKKFIFCNGRSDYGNSIKIIVQTQILVILLATLTTGFRLRSKLFQNVGTKSFVDSMDEDIFHLIVSNGPFLEANTRDYLDAFLRVGVAIGFLIVAIIIVLPCLIVALTYAFAVMVIELCCPFRRQCTESLDFHECRNLLIENEMELEEWTLTKCVDDMKKWTDVGERSNSLSHLTNLLSNTHLSEQSLEQFNRRFTLKEGKEVSCLHLVFLVKIAAVSIPSIRSGHLERSLNEVFDIIHFIDTKMNSLRLNNTKRCKLAKALLKGEDFNSVVPKIVDGSKNEIWKQSPFELPHALEIINELKNVLPSSFIWDEVGIVMDTINRREYESLEEL